MSETFYRTYKKSGVVIAEPIRLLAAKEWERLFDEIREGQITGLSCACGPEEIWYRLK